MSLQGKVAIVTGGNSGIGKSIVLALGRAGASVCVDYVVHQDITADERVQVEAMVDRLIAVKADVSQVAEVQKLLDETVKAFGRVDIMVNNAGIETRTSVLDTTEASTIGSWPST
jgi:glucose 1-dehydrogenase